MRILIAGGGTAGHVYPNITIVQAVPAVVASKKNERIECLYLGGSGSVEESLVSRYGMPFQAIQSGGLRGKKPWTIVWNGLKLMIGLMQSYTAIGKFQPDTILATGGYSSVPVVLAGHLRRVPILIYLPDIVPGLAIQRLSRWASRVAVTFSETMTFFQKEKVVVTGYPVRQEFFGVDKSQARTQLALKQDQPVVMIFGGSRGARSINQAVAHVLPDLLQETQVIHICGSEDIVDARTVREKLPSKLKERYHPSAYLHDEMVQAMAAADLVVARAGASILGEFPALGLPSILVPYPYSGQHQEVNADYMVKHGAAVKLLDADLKQNLLSVIVDLLGNTERLEQMRSRARSLSRPDAARRIATELLALADKSAQRRLEDNGYLH